MSSDIKPKTIAKIAGGVMGGILLLSTAMGSFFTVDQKNADVVTHFNKFSHMAEPGLNFKMPFVDAVIPYTTATQQEEIDHATTNTADNQQAYPTLIVQYNATLTGIKIIYEKYPNIQQKIYNLSSDIMKNVFGTYQVMDIPSSRQEIEGKIMAILKPEALRLYGMEITEVQIKNIDYTDAFNTYINNMTKSKAEVEQAKQKQLQTVADAQSLITQAEGQAKAEKAKAEGAAYSIEANAKAEADSIRLKGEAEADAIKAKTEALNASPQFVNYTIAQQWDGKLPENIGVGASSSSIPMVNIGGIH